MRVDSKANAVSFHFSECFSPPFETGVVASTEVPSTIGLPKVGSDSTVLEEG